MHPVGPAEEQVAQAGSQGWQDVLFALKNPEEQALMEVAEAARVNGAGSQAVVSTLEICRPAEQD